MFLLNSIFACPRFVVSRMPRCRLLAGSFWSAVCVLMLLRTPPVVRAQDTVPVPTPLAEAAPVANGNALDGIAHAAVRVNGREVLELSGTRPEEVRLRADRVELRLQRLIEQPEAVESFTPRDIIITGGLPLITLSGQPLLTVTQLDAENNLMTPQDLALLWGDRLQVAVAETRLAQANPLRGVEILIRYAIRDLVHSIVRWLPRLAGAILVWLVFWGLARLCRWFVTSATERIHLDANLRQLARAITFYGVWAAGFVAVLSTLGIDSGNIATAVGISGFVLGFAFKDILSHFFAGLMLLIGRQFHIGGSIVVGEFEGTVERIELRALHLRTYDNRLVIIPNGDVFTSTVISNAAYSHRRREFFVGISYREDIERAQQVALDAVRQVTGVLVEPQPQVLVHALGGSTVNLRVLYYITSSDSRVLKIDSATVRAVKEAFEREAILISNDLRDINLHNVAEIKDALREVLTLATRDGTNGTHSARHNLPTIAR